MRWREFITLFGGAPAWPVMARAQQPAVPVIGFLDLRSPEALTDRLRGFRQGLRESGYVEGDNVTVNPRRRLRLFIVLRQGIRVGRHAGPSTGLSHQVGVDVSRTRINTRIMRNFRLGTLLPTQECVITF
jgi:hypothetical protein